MNFICYYFIISGEQGNETVKIWGNHGVTHQQLFNVIIQHNFK
jgi:hypothetical protein